MRRILSDMQREFKRNGHCVCRVRVQFAGSKLPTNNIVQDRMHDQFGRDMIEGMMILAAVNGAEGVAMGMEAFALLSDRNKKYETQFNLEVARERQVYQHPRRKECLMLAYQTPEREIQAMALISREPTKLHAWDIGEVPKEVIDDFHLQFPNAESKFGMIYEKAKRASKLEWIAKLLAAASIMRDE